MKKLLRVAVLSTSMILGGMTATTGFIGSNQVEAASSVKISKTTYQSTANLNLRTSSTTSSKRILTIPKGKTVVASEKKGSWYKVSYSYKSNGKTTKKYGWVSGKYLKEYYKYSKTSGTYYFTKKTTKLYSTPDTKKKAVYSLSTNNGLYSTQKVTNSLSQTWYRVSYKGKTLYVNSSYVSKQSKQSISKTTYKAKIDTYVYEKYGKSFAKLVKITEGKTVSSTYRIGNWYKVSYSSKSGYIYIGDFSKVATEPKLTETALSGKTYLITANLNLRKSASNSSTIQKVIPKGKIVVPTHKVSNGWYKISYGGKTGYASGSYVKEVKTGDPLKSRDSYQFIDLRTKSPVTATQINNYIAQYVNSTGKKSVLTAKGQAFINAGNKYGVNALYLAAHAIHESAYGTSNISLGKYNLFGFGAYDAAPFVAAYRFSSVDKNIEYIAQEMKATYLNPNSWKYNGAYLGFSTKTMSNARVDDNSEGMNFYYASDPLWGKGIAAHMQKILPFDKKYYSTAKPNTNIFAFPTKPSGSDKFPSGIIAVAKKELGLTSKKGSTSIVKKISKGKEFTIIEKTNDFWVRVKYGENEYWTSTIKFDQYTNYLYVRNLGRVNISALNVRPSASTSKEPIGALKLNQYVQLVLDKDDKLTMNSTKTWYKVKLTDGKTGWVNASYITRELK